MKWLKGLLVLGLLAVVGMAFRVSWNALRDVAVATGADPGAADLYAFVVDGLLVVALVAALILTGDGRRFALRVLAGYTAASLALNYVHGMVPELHQPDGMVRLADWAPAHWALVLLATSLPVGSIYFGSDLVAKVLHHQPETAQEPANSPTNQPTDEAEPVAVPAAVPVEVCVPVAYPKRPETVPAGVRLLPIVARPEPAREAIPAEPQTVVPAGEPARTRVESDAPDGLSDALWRQVRGDDAPGPESGVEAADPLTEQVGRDFPEYADGHALIPYRLLRERYGIGQDRAKRIRDALRTGQPTSSTTETYSEVLA